MIQWLRLILQNLAFQVSNAPTPIYEDSQPNIDIINSNHLTCIFKHISVLINYAHEESVLLSIDPVKLKPTIQPSDIGTKSSTVPLLKQSYSYIHGTCYYPLQESGHYSSLSLDTLCTPYFHMVFSKDL